MPVRILLVDDSEMVRASVKELLDRHGDVCVVAEASSGEEAVRLAQVYHPDLAVVDIGMKGMNGIEATAHIRRHSPQTAVLILTMHCNKQYVVRSLGAGARGYVLKDSLEEEDFVRAIHLLHGGGCFFSPAVAGFANACTGPPLSQA